MSNEETLNAGTELTLESNGAQMNDGDLVELVDDNRLAADSLGYTIGRFEFDTAAGGFSAAPTAGAKINIIEQRINSDVNDEPDPTASYKRIIGVFSIKPADEQQYLVEWCPIHVNGGKYWLEYLDGGAGTANVTTGWICRLTPHAKGN